MPQANIYFDYHEDKKIRKLSDKWDLSKYETVKRIIKEFKVRR